MKALPPDLFVVTPHAADHPVLDATLGAHLRMLGVPNVKVAVIGSGGLCPDWATESEALVRNGRFWLLRLTISMLVRMKGRTATLYVRDDVLALPFALVPRRLRSWTFIFDKRGLPAEEARLKGVGRCRVGILRVIERLVLRRADRVLAVSELMARELRGRGLRSDVAVVPNGFRIERRGVEEDVASFRADSSNPLVVYIGGSDAWQEVPTVIWLLAQLGERGIRTAVMSTDSRLRDLADSRGIVGMSGTREDALELLDQATALIAIRRNHLATRAASPIKIGEALSRGTGVIATTASWEGVQFLAEHGAAFILDADCVDVDALEGWVLARCADPGARASTIYAASQLLGLERYIDELVWFYGVSESS